MTLPTKDVTVDTNLTNITSLAAADRLLATVNATGILSDLKISVLSAYLDALLAKPANGRMINGVIKPEVVSNDLVLSIKTLAGTDPSSTDKVYININGSVRTIDSATSCTLADGTNWYGLGGTAFATIEQDLFAYAIWDSNSSVVAVAPARIPYGRLVSDFSATTTNEKHLGNYANYTSTDDVCVIGRFAATLSAGAGYTWTVPSFTNSNLIKEPIFETRLLTYVPTLTGFSGGNDPTSAVYRYKVRYDTVKVMAAQGGNGTSNATAFSITAPFTAVTISSGVWASFGYGPVDNGTFQTAAATMAITSNTASISIFKNADAGTTTWTNVNGKRVAYFELEYPLA